MMTENKECTESEMTVIGAESSCLEVQLQKDVTDLLKMARTDRFIYAMVMCTNCFRILAICEEETKELNELMSNALEVRLFCREGEIKWFRSNRKAPFHRRACMMDAELNQITDYYDQFQYLDIDSNKSNGEQIQATGGGRYSIPGLEVRTDVKVIIRNYLAYEHETGSLYIKDWRIVGFKSSDQEGGK